MFLAIKEVIELLLILINNLLYGDIDVNITRTHRSVKLSFNVDDEVYTFITTQFMYTKKYNGLFNSLKREYIYKVELLTTTDKIVGESVGYYLHMCPKWLFKTTYPHRLAINAHYRNSVQQYSTFSS